MNNPVQSLGFDKSQRDGIVYWEVAKLRNISWVTLRASWLNFPDTMYLADFQAASELGMNIIPYHWYAPKKATPQAQAAMFLSQAKHGNMPAMLDLEDNGATTGYIGIATKELKIWLDIVQNATGILPIIYASPSYIKNYLTKETWLSEYPLLIAHWRVAAPLIPKPWTAVNLAGWQFGGDDSDGKYYGFTQALGCSLQVFYDIERYKCKWETA